MLEQLDRFDVALRTWSSRQRVIDHGYSIVDSLDLDPRLADELQTAARVDDPVALREAVSCLLEAVDEELASRSA